MKLTLRSLVVVLFVLASSALTACGEGAPDPLEGHWKGQAVEQGPAGSRVLLVDVTIGPDHTFTYSGCGYVQPPPVEQAPVELLPDGKVGGCAQGHYVVNCVTTQAVGPDVIEQQTGGLCLSFTYVYIPLGITFSVDLPLHRVAP